MNGLVLDPRTGRPERRFLLGPDGERINRVCEPEVLDDIEFLAKIQMGGWKWHWSDILERGELICMDGVFYRDLREPFMAADGADITLTTTDLALLTTGQLPPLGGSYFNRIGKKVYMRLFGKMTTAATPGNGSWTIYYGTNAAANGVAIVTSAVSALTAGQTTLSWEMECRIRCASLGATGTLRGTGSARYNPALMASTVQPQMIPASASVDSAACDLTAALLLSPQYKRSGSTAEHMWCQDFEFEALN